MQRSISLKPDNFDRPRGELEVLAFDAKTGRLVRIFRDGNIVVNLARATMAHLVSDPGASSQGYVVTTMKFGQGGHDPNNPTLPIPPTTSDTDLNDPITGNDSTQAVSFDYPDGPMGTKVRFAATIPAVCDINGTPPAGQAISEAGLFSDNGNMFAKKTFGILTKTEEIAFTFRWTIIF